MKSLFLIVSLLLGLNSYAQVRTTGGGTILTETKNIIDVTAKNFNPEPLSDNDSAEKKFKILGQYLAHTEYSCGLRRKIPKDLTILDSYYNIAFGTKVPSSHEIGKHDLCQHSDKVNSCLKKKSQKLNEIMDIVNRDKNISPLIQKQLMLDSESTKILLEFFTRQGQMNSK